MAFHKETSMSTYPSDDLTTASESSTSAVTNDDDSSRDTIIPELDWSDVRVGRLLGKGAFSKVKEVTCRSKRARRHGLGGRRKFAIKFLRNSTIQDEIFSDAAVDLAVEGQFLRYLQHPHILTMHAEGCFTWAYDKECRHFLILDRLDDDTLDQRIHAWQAPLLPFSMERSPTKHWEVPSQLERIQSIALPIAKAMEYLHSNQICFRDLKPHNIGFKKGTVKLFDFGMARMVNKDRKLMSRVGSPLYMAPEVMLGNDSYGLKVDVYSFSIMLWELLTLERPFEGMTRISELETGVVRDNVRPPLDRSLGSVGLQQLLASGWSQSPGSRPTFTSIRKVLENEVKVLSSEITLQKCIPPMQKELGVKELASQGRAR